jgi:hypothetical protein
MRCSRSSTCELDQAIERRLPCGERVDRRYGHVEHVARDHDSVRALALHEDHHLVDHRRLLVEDREVPEALAEVPVDGVEDPMASLMSAPRRCRPHLPIPSPVSPAARHCDRSQQGLRDLLTRAWPSALSAAREPLDSHAGVDRQRAPSCRVSAGEDDTDGSLSARAVVATGGDPAPVRLSLVDMCCTDNRHTGWYLDLVKPFRWSSQKNELLQAERGVSFEMMVVSIAAGGLVDILQHPNPARYPQQRILVVVSDGYAYLVPFVEESDHFFLKTVIPSRKATRTYLGGVCDDEG